MNPDICVIGGGVAGLCAARALAGRGRKVALVESDQTGHGASYAAAGMLAPLVEAHIQEHETVGFGFNCLRQYPGFVHGLQQETGADVDYRTEGTMIVGVDRDQGEQLRHNLSEQQQMGLPVSWLTGSQCREREPMLTPRVVGGIDSPGDHQINNRLLLDALKQSCIMRGVSITEHTGDGRLKIHSSGEFCYQAGPVTVECRQVVVATGAHTEILKDVLPEIARSIRPVKGQVMRLDQSSAPLLDRVVRSPEIYLVPKSDGSLVMGASSEDKGFDPGITAGEIYELLRSGWECLPGVYELPILETRVGFRPASRDHKPVVGATRVPGLWLAMGYYRHGILFAPIAAEILARAIGGPPDDQDSKWLDAFSPHRFA